MCNVENAQSKTKNKLGDDDYIDIDKTRQNPAFIFISNMYFLGALGLIIYAASEYISYLSRS
ncbi:MAG: hypothetical protein IPI65_18540 [Bacteroidetes bacterium]|nr:hypothetical protein [Bacteroidota bacterium]